MKVELEEQEIRSLRNYFGENDKSGFGHWGFEVFDDALKRNETFQDRLIEEEKDLQEKVNKLSGFIGTDKFEELSTLQKLALVGQLKAMKVYLDCLKIRLKDLQTKDEKES